MDAAIAGLFGAFIGVVAASVGAIITVRGSLTVQKRQRQAERESIASAFYGEISALLSIIQTRQYIKGIEESLSHLQQTKALGSLYSFRVTRSYFNVYEKSVDKIGLLPVPLPEKIAFLYTIAFAILEDVDFINATQVGNWEAPEIRDFLQELLDLFREAVNSGQEIQASIEDLGLLSKHRKIITTQGGRQMGMVRGTQGINGNPIPSSHSALLNSLASQATPLPTGRNKTEAAKILVAAQWDFDREDKTIAAKTLLKVGWTYEEVKAVLAFPFL